MMQRVELQRKNSILGIETCVDDILYDVLHSGALDYEKLDVQALSLEHIWRPRDIFVKNGSGYTPSIFIDLVGWTQEKHKFTPTLTNQLLEISKVYGALELKTNGHAHDKDALKYNIPVLNITSMAVALKSLLNQDIHGDIRFIGSSQRKDGIFPYVKPHISSTLYGQFGRGHDFVQRNIFRDRAYSFYDMCHHAMILNFLSIAHNWCDDAKEREYIGVLVKNGLKFLGHGSDIFSLEPEIYAPRYCNFSDINAYFILIKVLKYWQNSDEKYTGHISSLEKSIQQLTEDEFFSGLVESTNSKWILPAQWMDPKYSLIHLRTNSA
jgi:hypothetical protein